MYNYRQENGEIEGEKLDIIDNESSGAHRVYICKQWSMQRLTAHFFIIRCAAVRFTDLLSPEWNTNDCLKVDHNSQDLFSNRA